MFIFSRFFCGKIGSVVPFTSFAIFIFSNDIVAFNAKKYAGTIFAVITFLTIAGNVICPLEIKYTTHRGSIFSFGHKFILLSGRNDGDTAKNDIF